MRCVGNDWAFVTTMGVDVQTFEALLTHFSQAWDNTTISRSDVDSHGAPWLHKRSLDAAGGLGLLLHWLSSTMAGHSLHQIFAITPANAYYNGWTCSHYCSNILTFAPDGSIIHAILNAPGSRLPGDQRYSLPSSYKAARLSDCGPFQVWRLITNRPSQFARLKLCNNQWVSARQAAEWGMRSIQGSFSRLKLPLPAADHKYRAEVIELAVRLHQVKCRSVGINQTQTVYQTVESENRMLARTFHRMLFSQIQRTCRITRYYHGWL
ncbi:hypothetical protein PSTG_12342 [Puccinia striiformis f. sp. tritici PST-78]|uniref:DDE Tnp4 domain-containing protein n=1 Tax=Puccinia striiformis f. sp. tritici PST-78 TaxID=1165861 RepID=A0A0L0V4V9_9BASI|nr:hypothetical protein PSTG_12342 [Puccinia striiformis f. sp. tritici PST-78]